MQGCVCGSELSKKALEGADAAFKFEGIKYKSNVFGVAEVRIGIAGHLQAGTFKIKTGQ